MSGIYQHYIPEPSPLTQMLARHAERSYDAALARLGGSPPTPDARSATLHLFDSAWAFQDYMSTHLEMPIGRAAGFFYAVENDHGIAMHVRETPVMDLLITIQHECLHHAVYDIYERRLPRWLNEGLAQYFQDGLWLNQKLKLGMGDVDRLERLRISDGQHAGVEELQDTHDLGWFESEIQSAYGVSRLYESAWAVVLTLANGPVADLRKRFMRYLKLMRRPDAAHVDAWGRAMDGISPRDIDYAVWDVLQQTKPRPLPLVINKLSLLGIILTVMQRGQQRMPATIEEARNRIRLLGFEVQRRTPGSEPIKRHADDESLYYYLTADGFEVAFDLQPQQGDPPILSAPLVDGEPELHWYGHGRKIVPWLRIND